jgi:glucose uptake protein
MYVPHSYQTALLFMIGSMLCWGSWANTMKLCPGYRFQLFYWDYILGLLAGTILLGFSLGSSGRSGLPFVADLQHMPGVAFAYALAGGVVFNIANLLLVAAIEIAGMAVAFPVGIGLALIVGALSSYLLAPQGNPLLLFGGLLLITAAIVCDSLAYRQRQTSHRGGNARGLMLSLLAGALMGTFYPLVSHAMTSEHAPGPYATAFVFVLGVVLCALPLNYVFMRRPIDGGTSVTMRGFTRAPLRWHIAGILGGMIWACGGTLNFVASRVHFVGPAVSYSIGQGATMVSAVWGVFIWHEFRNPSARVRALLIAMFLSFIAGLTAVAVAPIF